MPLLQRLSEDSRTEMKPNRLAQPDPSKPYQKHTKTNTNQPAQPDSPKAYQKLPQASRIDMDIQLNHVPEVRVHVQNRGFPKCQSWNLSARGAFSKFSTDFKIFASFSKFQNFKIYENQHLQAKRWVFHYFEISKF